MFVSIIVQHPMNLRLLNLPGNHAGRGTPKILTKIRNDNVVETREGAHRKQYSRRVIPLSTCATHGTIVATVASRADAEGWKQFMES